jgi:competence ComEA-like helix-hairpin-helix protein
MKRARGAGAVKLAAISAICAAIFTCVAAAQQKQPPAHPLELNSATVEQLQQVPGIGPRTAEAIVNFREKSGPFRRIEALLAIKGITQPKLDKMRPYLSVTPPPAKPPQP